MCVTLWKNSEVKLLLCETTVTGNFSLNKKNISMNNSTFSIFNSLSLLNPSPSIEEISSFNSPSSSIENISSFNSPSPSIENISSFNSPSPSIEEMSSPSLGPSSSKSESLYSMKDEHEFIKEIINNTNSTNVTGIERGKNVHINQPNDLLHLFWLLLLLVPLGILFFRSKRKTKICPQPKHKLYRTSSVPNLGVIPSAPPKIIRSMTTGDLKPANYTSTLKDAAAVTRPHLLNTSHESSKTDETVLGSPHPPLPPENMPVTQKSLPKLPQNNIVDLESGGRHEND